MSYDIFIGEAEIGEDDDGNPRMQVRREEHPDAPAFPNDPLSQHRNGRHPGYGTWHEWTKIVGLESLFFDKKSGLMREHPGIARIYPRHLALVRRAVADWKRSHPAAVPAFPPDEIGMSQDPAPTHTDPVLARLVWLEWWMAWALINCQRPSLENY